MKMKKIRKLYTLDKEVAEFIRDYAWEKRKSASDLINSLFKGLKKQKEELDRAEVERGVSINES